MTPVQEAKQELEASIRYCENAISRATQTIESMATYQEQTGREEALERELEELRGIIDRMGDDSIGDSVTIKQLREERDELLVVTRQATDEARLMTKEFKKAQAEVKSLHERLAEVADLKVQIEGHRTNMALMSDEIAELEKAYKNECHETEVYKKSWREQREIVALKDDQIAMLERRLAKHAGEKTYPFKEGDIYYVFSALDGKWIESVWDDESERIHDSPSIPSHPHRVYFTIDQKHVIEQFNPESS